MIDNKFELQRTIGHDEHADYVHVQDYLYSDYIMKVIKPNTYSSFKEAVQTLNEERKISLLFEGHSNLLQSYGSSSNGFYKSGSSHGKILYSLQEYWRSSTMRQHILVNGIQSLDFTMKVFLQLLDGLEFMHNKEYVHLNLSLDNICLDQNLDAKLAEVEKAQYCDPWEPTVEKKTGIYPYRAPEMEESFNDLYDSFWADVFSLAVWIFEMLTGIQPREKSILDYFYNYNVSEDFDTDDLIHEELVEKPGFEQIPSELKALLWKMTLNEPLNRPTIEEIRLMPWIKRALDIIGW